MVGKQRKVVLEHGEKMIFTSDPLLKFYLLAASMKFAKTLEKLFVRRERCGGHGIGRLRRIVRVGGIGIVGVEVCVGDRRRLTRWMKKKNRR